MNQNLLAIASMDVALFMCSVLSIRSLAGNELVCDCDLYWLVRFIDSREVSGAPPLVTGAECAGLVNTAINNSTLNYSHCIGQLSLALQLLHTVGINVQSGDYSTDLCSEGLHSCEANATCVWNQTTAEASCVCVSGFVANGTACVPVCESELNICHTHATCEWSNFTEQVVCSCEPGYFGSGLICQLSVSRGGSATLYPRPTSTATHLSLRTMSSSPPLSSSVERTSASVMPKSRGSDVLSTTAVIALSSVGLVLLIATAAVTAGTV